MQKTDPIQTVNQLLQPILEEMGLELVEIEYKRNGRSYVLRIFIDKPGGVTLDDCADLSRQLSIQLDLEDCIPGRYTLEVSSPGLDRPLKKEQDFIRYQGKLAVVKCKELLKDEKGTPRKTFLGTISGMEEGIILMQLKEGGEARIPFGLVSKANLEFEF